jgi:hypothetical protein
MRRPFTIEKLPKDDDWVYALIGPDDLVWHTSWCLGGRLPQLRDVYNAVFEMGFDSGLKHAEKGR